MDDLTDPKAALLHYLQEIRGALLWKLDGLTERQVRLPQTSTGLNLLGIVKHCLNGEAGYLGETFGRPWPTPDELVPLTAYDTDPQADFYATAEETRDGLLDLYRRVGEHSDETIRSLPLDAPGRVPWWPADRGPVTLHRIVVHITQDISRHTGQADVIREQIDGAVGMLPDRIFVPDDTDWAAYRTRLTALAERFG